MKARGPSRTGVRLAVGWLGWVAFLALAAPFVANDQPLRCVCGGNTYYPLFQPRKAIDFGTGSGTRAAAAINWKDAPCERKRFPLVPFNEEVSDQRNLRSARPGARNAYGEWHLFGTTDSGGDVLAMLIHGSRTSLGVGVGVALLVIILGLLAGALAGYFGDTGLRARRGFVIGLAPGAILAWFYGLYLWDAVYPATAGDQAHLGEWVLRTCTAGVCLAGSAALLGMLPGWWRKKIAIPLDLALQKVMEVLEAIPVLVLILAVAATTLPSVWTIMALIAVTSWTAVARLVRAEMLRIRSLDYIAAAKCLGLSPFRIWLKHALPHALTPAWVLFAFAVAGALMAESVLSYLGLLKQTASWGSLAGRVTSYELFSAWWIAAFPGSMIFLTVLACNTLGEAARSLKQFPVSPPNLQ